MKARKKNASNTSERAATKHVAAGSLDGKFAMERILSEFGDY